MAEISIDKLFLSRGKNIFSVQLWDYFFAYNHSQSTKNWVEWELLTFFRTSLDFWLPIFY